MSGTHSINNFTFISKMYMKKYYPLCAINYYYNTIIIKSLIFFNKLDQLIKVVERCNFKSNVMRWLCCIKYIFYVSQIFKFGENKNVKPRLNKKIKKTKGMSLMAVLFMLQ